MSVLLPTRILRVGDLGVRGHVAGDGEPVLLLHGFPETLQAWSAHVAALASRYRVHAFDWPGLGGSDAPTDFEYSPNGYARFLEEYLDAQGIGSAHLVATDVGVPAALLLALRRPDRVRRLVLFDGPVFDRPHLLSWEVLGMRARGIGEIMARGFPRTCTWLAFERGFFGRRRITPDQYEDFAAQARRPRTREAALRLFRSEAAGLEAVERDIHRLQAPLLILWGAEDAFIRPEMGLLLKAACPQARLELAEACGHFPHHEAPEWFERQVLSHLGAQQTPTSD